MKILRRILFILLGISALFGGFILVCAFHPEITDAVADFLYSDDPDILTGQEKELADIADTPAIERHNEISIPDQVSGRNGYLPIKEEGEEIAEEEAQELIRQLGHGQTGEGLSFDSLFYPYYAMLDEKGQRLYRQIYANANSLNTSFSPVEEVQADELGSIFAAVYNDHPELFFMETAYYCKYRSNGQCVEIDLMYNRTADQLADARAIFEERAGQIIAGAEKLTGDYERERYVHDALIDLITYQASAEMGQSAYSALVNGQTVCAGYARAFQYILQQLSIPCYYCTGYAGENHAWNIVMLEDGYYNVDVTWDDIEDGIYSYFNKSDDDYASTHIRRDMAVNLPPCKGEKYRNIENGANDNKEERRSLEELGIAQEEVIYNLADYYEDCYEKISSTGTGSYTFFTVLEGEDFLQQCISCYRSEEYREAYMERAMEAVGASECQMELELEELKEGRYLVAHKIVLK